MSDDFAEVDNILSDLNSYFIPESGGHSTNPSGRSTGDGKGSPAVTGTPLSPAYKASSSPQVVQPKPVSSPSTSSQNEVQNSNGNNSRVATQVLRATVVLSTLSDDSDTYNISGSALKATSPPASSTASNSASPSFYASASPLSSPSQAQIPKGSTTLTKQSPTTVNQEDSPPPIPMRAEIVIPTISPGSSRITIFSTTTH